MPEITGTFLSPDDGTYTWAEYDDAFQTIVDQDSGTFYISGTEINNLAVRSRSIWASRDLVYLQTYDGPTEIEGVGEIDFWAELTSDHPPVYSLKSIC